MMLLMTDNSGDALMLAAAVLRAITVCQTTRLTRRRHAPVLALTASANPVDHDRCLASGMNDVLHKPLDEQQLISKISNALAQHALRAPS
jgi:CheY-like chemotaxis protein